MCAFSKIQWNYWNGMELLENEDKKRSMPGTGGHTPCRKEERD